MLYETGLAGELGILSLSLCCKADNNTKSSNIKETDGENVDFSDGGASFILPGTYAIWGKIICGITPGKHRRAAGHSGDRQHPDGSSDRKLFDCRQGEND